LAAIDRFKKYREISKDLERYKNRCRAAASSIAEGFRQLSRIPFIPDSFRFHDLMGDEEW